jgi:hypothetical protein
MGRKEKVTESASLVGAPSEPGFDASPANAPPPQADEPALELVADPGPVKRIHFEGPPAPPEPAPLPAAPRVDGEYRRAVVETRPGALREHSESIYTIHEQVDHIGAPDPRFSGAPPRANLRSWRSSVVYRTDHGGEVRAYESPAGRTLTLADGREERRFSEAEVDRVIANVRLEGDRSQLAETEAQAPEAAEPEPKRRSFFSFRRKGRETTVAVQEAAPAAAEPAAPREYQPQCSALTEAGLQCRNSARDGSKYCISHYGYQPRTAEGVLSATDTEPRYESSADTAPGAWDPDHGGSAQCIALTKSGKQCQNPIVAGSPFCGNHQGGATPTARSALKAADTKPRWSGAKDTKPSTRKSAKAAKRKR